MKQTVVLFSLLMMHMAGAANYTLTIDGKAYDIDEGKKTAITLADGTTIHVNLAKKSEVSFTTKNFTFMHPSEVSPARSDLGDGIHQTMMTTPLGTLTLIQEYQDLDPSMIIDLMISELTKEERNYGYSIESTPTERQTADGKTLSGKTVTATYRGEVITRDVLTYSARDAGLLVVTMFDNEAQPEELAMIETFWKTLKISLK